MARDRTGKDKSEERKKEARKDGRVIETDILLLRPYPSAPILHILCSYILSRNYTYYIHNYDEPLGRHYV